MAEEQKGEVIPPDKPASESWVPPTREEVEKLQKALANKQEEADRLFKKSKAIEEAEAKKRGEFEQLFIAEKTAREALEAEVALSRAALQAELDELLKGLPEDARALVDEDAPVAKRLKQAKAALKLVGKEKPAGTTAAAGSSAASTKFGGYADEIEWARNDYAAYKKYRDSQRR